MWQSEIYWLLATDYFFKSESFDCVGDAVLVVRGGRVEAPALKQGGLGVPHDDARARPFEHLKVVEVVADGHDLLAPESPLGGDPPRARAPRPLGGSYVRP